VNEGAIFYFTVGDLVVADVPIRGDKAERAAAVGDRENM